MIPEIIGSYRKSRRVSERGRSQESRLKMLQIDRHSRLVYQDEKPVRLTAREFDLLLYLYDHAGSVCTRNELLNSVWGTCFQYDTGTLDVHVHSLRRKLSLPPEHPICTLRGVGYLYELEEQPADTPRDIRSFFNDILIAYTPQWKALAMDIELHLDPFVNAITIDTDILRRMVDAVMPLFLIPKGKLSLSTSLSVNNFTILIQSPNLELKLAIPVQN